MLEDETRETLIAAAREARERAYVPYSNFPVGAAVMCADGRVFQGCNIENAALGATICAERVAMFSAVAGRCDGILAIAVVGPPDALITPCGTCRQVMMELAPEAQVIMSGGGETRVMSVTELLPEPFELQ